VKIHIWHLFEQESEIAYWIETVFFGRLNNAVDCITGQGTLWSVGKQEGFPANYKRFDTAFGTIVADFQSAVQKKMLQIRPLSQCIVNGFSNADFGMASTDFSQHKKVSRTGLLCS
jgi:hypothetical protein